MIHRGKDAIRRNAKAARGFHVDENGVCSRTAEWRDARAAELARRREDLQKRIESIDRMCGRLVVEPEPPVKRSLPPIFQVPADLWEAFVGKIDSAPALAQPPPPLVETPPTKPLTVKSLIEDNPPVDPNNLYEPVAEPEHQPDPPYTPPVILPDNPPTPSPVLPWRERFRLIWRILWHGRIDG